MLEKTAVISNLRRILTRGSLSNARKSSGAGDLAQPEAACIPLHERPPANEGHASMNLSVEFQDSKTRRTDDISNVSSSANLLSYAGSNVASSVDLISMEGQQRKRDRQNSRIASRMRKVSERLSFSAAPDDLPLPATHHRIQTCLSTWMSGLIRIPILLTLLYLFVCSLDFLTTAFRLIAGKTAGTIFQSSNLLSNPIVGLMIAILFTVLVQSSSTCTSVIVSLVSSDILDVEMAIPMVMGANIGTSLTSTLVSLTQVANKDQFERAFAGATVHDCFNWLTVIVLMFLECTTGYLFRLTGWITESTFIFETGHNLTSSSESSQVSSATNVNILGALTKPLTKKIVQIDKSVLKCWSLGRCHDERLLKIWCNRSSDDETVQGRYCDHLMNIPDLSDTTVGIILLVGSLTTLSLCLILIVKVLSDLMKGTVAEMIRKTINADIPYVPWLTGYLAILMGAVLTFIVQSSSVFTTTLTPLVGVGLITVDRVYPLTLGSNLGTTTTAMIASLAADGSERLKNSLQIALCHFFFNLTGIILFYPIPFMRWPVFMCKLLGKITAKYRWFAVAYLLMMFFLLPGIVLALSMAGTVALFAVAGPVITLLTLVIIINVMQAQTPHILPTFLHDWSFLPLWMRSLEPADIMLRKMTCNFCCCSQYDLVPDGSQEPPPLQDDAHPPIVVVL